MKPFWQEFGRIEGMTGKYIIESFGQKGNNCVAIVLTKAAILHYGMHRIFKKTFRDGHYILQLQNGDIHAIAAKDVARLNQKNKLRFRKAFSPADAARLKRLKEYVELCFAVMVRSLLLRGYESKELTESEAIQLLTRDGINTDHVHHLLGLKRKTPTARYLTLKNLRQFRRKKAVLLYSDSHIALASEGYYDNYGKAEELNGRIPVLERKRARGWFELKN
jgi:hypothetical protein